MLWCRGGEHQQGRLTPWSVLQWSHQGVFLLNAVLTVRAHDAASHGKQGWEGFTDAAISTLSAHRKGLVFLLWGKYAQQKAALIDSKKHHILKAAHPSGFSANKVRPGSTPYIHLCSSSCCSAVYRTRWEGSSTDGAPACNQLFRTPVNDHYSRRYAISKHERYNA